MNLAKQITLAMGLVFFGLAASAHDEGHGPKLGDGGKYGGLMAAVIAKSDSSKGHHAAVLFKAELVRSEGQVRVYLYDQQMKPLELKDFSPNAEAVIATKSKGKWKNETFALKLDAKAYQGKMPVPASKPFNLEVNFTQAGRGLLAAFENLD